MQDLTDDTESQKLKTDLDKGSIISIQVNYTIRATVTTGQPQEIEVNGNGDIQSIVKDNSEIKVVVDDFTGRISVDTY